VGEGERPLLLQRIWWPRATGPEIMGSEASPKAVSSSGMSKGFRCVGWGKWEFTVPHPQPLLNKGPGLLLVARILGL
jgi:hypothetical protein